MRNDISKMLEKLDKPNDNDLSINKKHITVSILNQNKFLPSDIEGINSEKSANYIYLLNT